MNYLARNLIYLKGITGVTNASIALQVNKSNNTISNWINEVAEPGLEELIKLAHFLGVTLDDLVNKDLSTVHLNENNKVAKKQQIVHPNVHGNVHPKDKKKEIPAGFTINVVGNIGASGKSKMLPIPVTDLSVAAGGGIYNEAHIDVSESILLPPSLLKPGHTYLCGKIKGISMAPTLQDGGYVVIRLLDKSEWAKMPDERVFVVVDHESKAYLKRVKNRFKQGFIVLRSDNPDSATFPSFNLSHEEISMIWYVEWYFSAKLPNIHDQFYSRLQSLEDKVEGLEYKLAKK